MANQKKGWNVMVYLAGDNNLSEEMVWALTEMARYSLDPLIKRKVNVNARFDPRGAETRSYKFRDLPKKGAATSDPISEAEPTLDKFRVRIEPDEKKKDLQAIKTIKKKQLERNAKSATEPELTYKFTTKIEELKTNPDGIGKLVTEKSADPAVVEFFIKLSFDPHKNNLVVLSGHASGAAGEFLQDTDPASSLSIPEFSELLARVVAAKKQKIEILGMDTCVMSMIEVGYEVREFVKYLVGAEGFEQNIGWPYFRILNRLRDSTIPEIVSQEIVAEYVAYYRDYEIAGVSTDLAACDLSKFKPEDRLITAIKALACELERGVSIPSVKGAILVAHWEAQSYLNDQYVDLYDFCNQLQLRCLIALSEKGKLGSRLKDQTNTVSVSLANEVGEELKKAPDKRTKTVGLKVSYVSQLKFDEGDLGDLIKCCQGVKVAIDGVIVSRDQKGGFKEKADGGVVLKSCYTGPAVQHSHGLSIYFPWSAESKDKELKEYKKLQFARETGWAGFLEKYLDETRRERRPQPGQGEGDVLHIDPPVTSIVVPSFSPVRNTGVGGCRGLAFSAGGIKNPPKEFFRDKCGS
jgi:hypothetical protein